VNVTSSGPLLVWPNPVDDGPVMVQCSAADAATLRITDLMGRTILPVIRTVSADVIQIDASRLPAGVYELHMAGEQHMQARFHKR
jgi:hypothetical protein